MFKSPIPDHGVPYANKEDQKAFHASWYQRNRDRIIAKSKRNNPRYRKERKDWLAELKSQLKCVNCGEDRIPCLDFHHKDSKLKEFNIARAVNEAVAKERILEELAKCVVLCSNCHRLHHAGLVEW